MIRRLVRAAAVVLLPPRIDRGLGAAVDEADAAVASRYAADACLPPFTRERQEHERRRFAGAQTVLDQVMSQQPRAASVPQL
jgi:hypothetical protein